MQRVFEGKGGPGHRKDNSREISYSGHTDLGEKKESNPRMKNTFIFPGRSKRKELAEEANHFERISSDRGFIGQHDSLKPALHGLVKADDLSPCGFRM